jgi:hypothetical protein
MQTAYSVNCLKQNGGTIPHTVTHCESVEAAISKAVKELPHHCTTLKIVRLDDDSTVWEGTPQKPNRRSQNLPSRGVAP